METSVLKTGEIITFYSYKGGTGRSMALANVAWILASNGKRVLTVDWDFEAPGLHRYFLPFLHDYEMKETDGLIDLLWEYMELAATPVESRPIGAEDPLVLADPLRNAIPLEFPFNADNTGCVHLLGAGRQTRDYAGKVRDFNWNLFYQSFDGGNFFDLFRNRMKEQYDYVLIDSRTGVSDTAGICTLQMPDKVVLCFAYNRQSIKGVEAVADSIKNHTRNRKVEILPIPMRVVKDEAGHKDARQYAKDILEKYLPGAWPQQKLDAFWGNNEIQHYPLYSFQEILAVFRDKLFERNTLLDDYCWITGELTDGFITEMTSLDESIRNRYVKRAEFGDPRLSLLKELMAEESETSLQKIIDLSTVALQASPVDPLWLEELFKALSELTKRFMAKGRMSDALPVAQKTTELGEALFVLDQERWIEPVTGAINLFAYMQSSQNRYEEAVTTLKRAVKCFKYGRFPEDIRKIESTTYFTWGNALGYWARQKSAAEQDRLLSEAFDKYAEAVRINPDLYVAFNNWGNHLISWAQQKSDEERERLFEDAFLKFIQAEQIKPGFAAYNLACLCALRGNAVEALQWLVKSKEAGKLPNREHIVNDKDLESIREMEEFRRIIG